MDTVYGFTLRGKLVVCPTCYVPAVDEPNLLYTLTHSQGERPLWCDVCGQCVQDGPDPEPEPDVWSDRWGYL